MAQFAVDLLFRSKNGKDLDKATKKLKGVDTAAKKAQGSSDKLGKALKGVGTSSRAAANGITRTGRAARTSTKAVAGLGTALQAALLPLAGFAAVAKYFQGFQEADRAAAAVRTLGVDAKALEKQLQGVAKRSDGLASTTQLMAAAYDVASAGFSSAGDNAKILEASLKGATGGMSDIATVSDAATSVLNAYGLSADKVGKLVDGFIQTQNDGKIVVDQFASQVGRLAPIASAAGVSIEEMNAAISTVTASGVPIESTFAGIRQGIAAILKPSGEAQKLSKQLGIEFNATALKAKGLGGVLKEVQEKTGGSTAALTQLFGSVEAVGAILPILNGDMETFNTNLDNQKTKSGQAADAADVMGTTVSKSIGKMINKIDDLVRKLDTFLGPAIGGIITMLNGVIDAASNAITTLGYMFSMSKDKKIALEVIGNGDLRGGFGRGLAGIDEIIGQERRKQLQKESGFGGLTNPFSNSNDRDKKFLEALRNEPKIKELLSGPTKTAAAKTPTIENSEVVALRKQVEQLLDGGGTGTSKGTGTRQAAASKQLMGKVIEVLTGDKSSQFYRADHGGQNYHVHVAFETQEQKELAKALLQSKGIQIGSENDGKHASGSYHYSNQAFDVPMSQVPVGQEDAFSKQILGILGKEFGGLLGGGGGGTDVIGQLFAQARVEMEKLRESAAQTWQQMQSGILGTNTNLEQQVTDLNEINRLVMEGMDPSVAETQVSNQRALLDIDAERISKLSELSKLQGLSADELKTKEEAINAAFDKRLSLQGQLNEGREVSTQLAEQQAQAEQLKQQVSGLASGIASEFTSAFKGVIDGTKDVQTAFSEMLQGIADRFLDFAMQLIQDAITQQLIGLFAGLLGGGGGGGGLGSFGGGSSNLFGNSIGSFGGGTSFFAEGGYVSGPTAAVVGEGGEPEYVIPESKMKGAMSRYSMGNRGDSVLSGGEGGEAGVEGGSTNTFTLETTVINNVEYATIEQVRAMGNSAAKRGAEGGKSQTLGTLRNSRSQRARLGI